MGLVRVVITRILEDIAVALAVGSALAMLAAQGGRFSDRLDIATHFAMVFLVLAVASALMAALTPKSLLRRFTLGAAGLAVALAGLLMLRLAITGQTVVIATRDADESRRPVGALEEARRVVEGEEFYGSGHIRRHAPGACARMAMVHAEAVESEFTAFLVAARLHELWTIREEALRAPPEQDRSAEIVPFPLEESRSFDPRPCGHLRRAPLFARLFGPFGHTDAQAPEGRPQ